MVGDIVLVTFPFTNLSQGKRRPALLIANVSYRRQADWIVCQITTQSNSGSRQIALADVDLEAGSLWDASWVRPDRLMTLNEGIFGRTIGRPTAAKQAEIAAAVCSLF